MLAGLLFILIGLIAVYATYAWLGLSLMSQDSSIPARGDWGYALIPGAVAVGAFWGGIALIRRGRASR